MAITYPLTLPTATGIRNIAFRARNAVAYNFSPFTFQGQAQAYSGQMWEADITLPPIKDRSDAEVWNAFILSLRGQLGTFTMGDPNGATARGTASTSAGSPVISSQIGSTIFVTGAPAFQQDICFRAIMSSSEADRRQRCIRCLLIPTLMVLAFLIWRYGRG